jgi:Rha family phage regulatory protein
MSANPLAPIALTPEEFIFASDNTLKTNSLKVAEAFGKLHKDVLEKIKKLDCSEDFRQRNFPLTQIETIMPTGGIRKDPAYEMTKDGFMFLVMGFTGKKAAAVKEAYIGAFNLMHDKLFPTAQTQSPSLTPLCEQDFDLFLRMAKNKGYVLVPSETIIQFQALRQTLNDANVYFLNNA